MSRLTYSVNVGEVIEVMSGIDKQKFEEFLIPDNMSCIDDYRHNRYHKWTYFAYDENNLKPVAYSRLMFFENQSAIFPNHKNEFLERKKIAIGEWFGEKGAWYLIKYGNPPNTPYEL